MLMQPSLFSEIVSESFDEQAKKEAGKSVVNGLLSIRQRLIAKNDLLFIHLLNDAIKAIRTEATLSDKQRETLVLNSIERSCANTYEEIAEDTRIPIETVKQIVRRLESENVLGVVPKTNRSRMKLIYSKRKRSESCKADNSSNV